MIDRALLLSTLLLSSLACDQSSASATPADASVATPAPEPGVADDADGSKELAEPEPEPGGTIDAIDDEAVDPEESSTSPAGTKDGDGAQADWWGPPGPQSRVRQRAATVRGPLDSDIIRRIVRAHVSELRSCYDAGLADNPSLAGEVTIEFTIDAKGLVSVSKAVDPDSFEDPKVPKCIATAAKTWRFPKPRDGGEVQVSYPFILEVDGK